MRTEEGLIRFSAIEERALGYFKSRADSAHLTLGLPDGSLKVSLVRMELDLGFAFASVILKEDDLREQLMREFCHARGLENPHDAGPHARAFAGLPVYLSYNFSPPPADPAAFTAFATDLFREVGGIEDDTELAFESVESGGIVPP